MLGKEVIDFHKSTIDKMMRNSFYGNTIEEVRNNRSEYIGLPARIMNRIRSILIERNSEVVSKLDYIKSKDKKVVTEILSAAISDTFLTMNLTIDFDSIPEENITLNLDLLDSDKVILVCGEPINNDIECYIDNIKNSLDFWSDLTYNLEAQSSYEIDTEYKPNFRKFRGKAKVNKYIRTKKLYMLLIQLGENRQVVKRVFQ